MNIIQETVNDPQLIQAASTWLSVNLIEAIKGSDLMGWICLSLTGAFSVLAWGVIAFKSLHIALATRQTNKFVDKCTSGGGDLHEAYRLAAAYPESPLANILREAYLELETEGWFEDKKGLPLESRLKTVKISIEWVLDLSASKEIRRMESWLSYLATTANVCPLIGLFGTVWGILGAFQAVAREGSAAISSLGPGVSTALMTTVAGLMAAIPAVIFYNYLVNKVQNLIRRMDSFGLEISNIIQKQLIKGGR